MKRSIILFLSLLISAMVNAQSFSIAEKALWKKQASTIKIIRDNWGVPHVYTNTDADAVFGMMYVQCEEYFSKVEDVIISRMGRESEVQGKSAIYKDLWSRLYIDTNQAKALYFKCDPYLRKLCDAYAAGINYFILTHPDVKTKLLKRVEPWIPLMNNIPSVTNSNLTDADIKSMYPIKSLEDIAFNNITLFKEDEKAGSNGWAISGKNTKDKIQFY